MEPVECPPPHSIHIVKVAWTHSVWVTFDIFKDLMLQEGPHCGVEAANYPRKTLLNRRISGLRTVMSENIYGV